MKLFILVVTDGAFIRDNAMPKPKYEKQADRITAIWLYQSERHCLVLPAH
jgi:hypothetical protein